MSDTPNKPAVLRVATTTRVAVAPEAPATPKPAVLPPVTRRVGRVERCVNAALRPRVMWPVVIVSVAMVGWSVMFRWTGHGRALAVSARETTDGPAAGPPVSAETLSNLQAQAATAGDFLVRQPTELGPLVAQFESTARAHGWRAKVEIKPVVTDPFGLTNLAWHPLAVQLRRSSAAHGGTLTNLLGWMRDVSALPHKTDISRLQIRASAESGLRADVEARCWRLVSHEETAAK